MKSVSSLYSTGDSDDDLHPLKVKNNYYDDLVPSGVVKSTTIHAKGDVEVLQEEFPGVPKEKVQEIYLSAS